MSKICEFCGKSYRKRLLPEAYFKNNCFDCSFWLKKLHLSKKNKKRQAIIDGHHYMICSDDGYLFKGCGGRDFHIVFHDGRDVKTSNMWEQGRIPEEFRGLLPDNAEFVPVEEPEKVIFADSEIPF